METLKILALALLLSVVTADMIIKPPYVSVYTQEAIEFGKMNHIICYAQGFYPPLIDIKLKKNGDEIPNCRKDELSFKPDWTYYTMVSVPSTIEAQDKIECEISHNQAPPKKYSLDTGL
ncbi:hypothetical protein GDO86_018822 [Hymenochirus boettgeri]|uniref:Immunoglobulin C1-set domain-containing protein n=1 Tax=Hymenochirus boettgeri TaxID=247094 RepID=A0A8T2ING2_9PIPI|nr:hypothetical protein GDO86_018822 [Hymenochirus boettgeri]